MTLEILKTVDVVLVCLPLAYLAARSFLLRHDTRFIVVAAGYVVFAVNELAFRSYGSPYSFFHVFVEGLVISLALPNLVAPAGRKPYYPAELLFPYAFLFLGMLAASALTLVSPAKSGLLASVTAMIVS